MFLAKQIMKPLLTLLTLSFWALCITDAQAQEEQPQSEDNASFLEISIGTRTFANAPGNVFIVRDSLTTENLDFGKGQPLAASLGFVFLPNEPGWAGKFSIDGYLGNTSGFGFDIGGGYKFGNEKFSFAPMLSFSVNRMFTSIESYNIDSTIVFAEVYQPQSDNVYVGGGVDLHGGSGSSINYNLNYAIFDFRLSAYTSYKVSDKVTVFGRFAYNLNVGKSQAKFEVTGKGYESFDAFMQAAQAEADGIDGDPPGLISNEVEGDDFMRHDGEPVDKVPVNFSGLQLQFGIGINLVNN
jgi:hypothetical protein